ncbi:MAG: helix-turn-helix domain-containing protein [Halanaerobiales bacterium]|nr:helix-turn-helix domain-containing protein [Halanaerobiales bacterium]
MKKIKVSGIDKIEIKRMYEDGMGTRKIASNFPFSRTVVKRVLNELNININNKVPTKYKYNYNIFKKIDSKGKAY